MEQRISELEGVEDCVLVFETKQLRVTGENPDALLPEIRKICSGIESEAKVIAPKPKHYGKDGQRVYTLENLGCAHCAAKMQHQISQLDGIDDCVLVYETKQLRVKGDNPDALLPEIRKICSNIESEVKIIAPEEEKEESISPSACRNAHRCSAVRCRSAHSGHGCQAGAAHRGLPAARPPCPADGCQEHRPRSGI